MIIGVDEVGRGSWAGPVCVAAVAWPDGVIVDGLNDSKQVAAKKRPLVARLVKEHATSIGIGWVAAAAVDNIGVARALQHAAQCAVAELGDLQAPIVVDGRDRLLGDIPAQYVIKADTTVPAVMAASIIAKVARDTYMQELDKQFGRYQFSKHVGYGTVLHRQLIAQFGPCEHHRLSYAPLKAYAS
ncbi:MAG TPA: ribonuclease HII [Candidatus Saccharimonadales bacterium]|nr:ribonuclease HII [Candidatus Saccharimonadales bacterium]